MPRLKSVTSKLPKARRVLKAVTASLSGPAVMARLGTPSLLLRELSESTPLVSNSA